MKDKSFLWINDDWLAKEFDRLQMVHSLQYVTVKIALNLLLQSEGKLIVETGSIRMKDDPGGAYTLIWGAFCEFYEKRLITVDILPEVTKICKELTVEYADHITYVTQDSVKFLESFNDPIDLLFLDSMDCSVESDSEESQQHNFREFSAAKKNLRKGSLLLLDNNDHPSGGKTAITKNFLLKLPDWLCILDSAQSLWVKIK